MPTINKTELIAGGLADALADLGATSTVRLKTNDATAAAANLAAIQAAIDAGGRVTLAGNGVAFINGTVQPGDFTDLHVPAGLTIRQADGTNKSLIKPKAASAAQSAITVAWTKNHDLTVTLANHGLRVRDWFAVNKTDLTVAAPSGQTQYLGVFPVVSVTDANTFTVRMRDVPTAACSYALQGVKANRGIRISGMGVWDYNKAGNTGPTQTDTLAVVMYYAADVDLDMEVINAAKYCLSIGMAANVRYRIRHPDTFSDGVKIYGPAFDTVINGQVGKAGDDFLSLQPKEAAGFPYQPFEGDIIGVTGGGLQVTSQTGSVSGITFYAHPVYRTDQVAIRGLRGENGYRGVNIRDSLDITGATTCRLGVISATDVDFAGTIPVFGSAGNGSTGVTVVVDKLTIGMKNCRTDGSVVNNPQLYFDRYLTVREFNLDFASDDPLLGSRTNEYPIKVRASISEFNLNLNVPQSATGLRLITAGITGVTQTLDRINITGYAKGDQLLALGVAADAVNPLFTNVPEVTLGGRFEFNSVCNAIIPVNLTLLGAVINNANLGVVRFNNAAGAVRLRSYGAVLLGTSQWATVGSAAGTLTPLSDEIQIDVGAAYVSKPAGARAFNTNAARGTLGAAGPVISDGTAWKLVADTTKSF